MVNFNRFFYQTDADQEMNFDIKRQEFELKIPQD